MYIAANRDHVRVANARPSAAVASSSLMQSDIESLQRSAETGPVENPTRPSFQVASPLYRPNAGRAVVSMPNRNAPPTRPFTDFGAARGQYDFERREFQPLRSCRRLIERIRRSDASSYAKIFLALAAFITGAVFLGRLSNPPCEGTELGCGGDTGAAAGGFDAGGGYGGGESLE